MGTDKALLELEGKIMLVKVIELCKNVCDKILISSNNPEHGRFSFPVVSDEIINCGPIGGIHAGLKKSDTDWNLIISVDSPFVEPKFLDFLISEINDFDALVPFTHRGKEPLIALYRKSCLGEINSMMNEGNYKIHNLINSVHTKWIEVTNWVEKYPKLLHNLNRPEDL